ncbi:hypothetical protein CsatA_012380 [Cannabis sativa]
MASFNTTTTTTNTNEIDHQIKISSTSSVKEEKNLEEEVKVEMSEMEKSKVGIMRALVQKQDPSNCKEVNDDLMIRRFLRARDMDVEKASQMFLKYLSWRHSFMPPNGGCFTNSDVATDIAHNKVFMQGHDKQGRPLLLVYGGRHKQHNPDHLKRKMPKGHEMFVAIGDLKGWGYANCDIRGYLAGLSILQIVFVDNKKLKPTLLNDIHEEQLPEIYGGKLSLVPIQDC